ncbi:DnaJ subfamily B member 13 [Cichlidogyrus casuarinus]|uniref:DnaJ subfamily B member 13 n=1 Tax=Cichlidogyrus casuarinus TaxID=1844966 RepID=A0ABD2PRL2_9PLAT
MASAKKNGHRLLRCFRFNAIFYEGRYFESVCSIVFIISDYFSYRSLALKFHPAFSTCGENSNDKFKLVSEAYEVLNNDKHRAIFDQFGEEVLKQGAPVAQEWSKPYIFHGDAFRTFQEFFGSTNPFECINRQALLEIDGNFGGTYGRGQPKQEPPIEQDLYITLEEAYNGCVKKMMISRRVLNADQVTTTMKDKILTMNIRPGWKEGTRITFTKEGDQGPNNIPADIVFILKDRQHDHFRREGSDLIHVAKIPLCDALIGCMLDIKTLDDRLLHVPITEIINPKYEKVVPNEGMPIPGKYKEFGNLRIIFDIVFPKILSATQRDQIKEALFVNEPSS